MSQVVERGQQEPRTKAVFFAGERATTGSASPENRPSAALGPDRDDAGSGVPSPEPLVFDWTLRCRIRLGDRFDGGDSCLLAF